MNKYCVLSVGHISLVHRFTEPHGTWSRVFYETQLFTLIFVLSSQLLSQHGGVTTATAALQVCLSHNDDTVEAVAASNWVFFKKIVLAYLIKISLWDILSFDFHLLLFCFAARTSVSWTHATIFYLYWLRAAVRPPTQPYCCFLLIINTAKCRNL